MPDGRILYLCLETPVEGQAVHTHVHEIIAGLRDAGWRVDLFQSRSGGASLSRSMLHRFSGFALTQVRALPALRRSDALYIRAHPAALPLAFAARLLRVPVFQEVNGKPEDLLVTYAFLRPLAWFVNWTYGAQLKRAAHVFPVTDGLRQWALQFSEPSRVTVVANGANTDLFSPQGSVADIPGPYVVFVGGLVAWHGIPVMLKALSDPAWPKDVRLVIAGDGVERDSVQAEARNPALLWLGRRPQSELPALLRGSLAALSIINSPRGRSDTGVAPIKLYEAMACGTPVIASDLPFQADLVKSIGAGLVIPQDDPKALASAVSALAADPIAGKTMGAAGAAYVQQNASWTARAKQISRIIATTIGR